MDNFEPHSAFDVVRLFILNDLCNNYIVYISKLFCKKIYICFFLNFL